MATQIKNIDSPMSQAVTVFRGALYMAVHEPAGNLVNILHFEAREWHEAGAVPGVRTPSPPALAVFQNRLYLAVRGQDNHIYLSSYDGVKWSNPWRAPGVGKTLAAPAIVQFGNLFHLSYSSERDRSLEWVAFNPTYHYGTYIVESNQNDLRDVARAVFGDPARAAEVALLNHMEPAPDTGRYPVQAGDVLLTPA